MIQGFFILRLWQDIYDLATVFIFTSTFILVKVAGGCMYYPDQEMSYNRGYPGESAGVFC